MALDTTVALLTDAEISEYLGLDKYKESYNSALIWRLVNSASRFIAKATQNKFLATTAYADTFSGNGKTTIYLDYAPLTSTISTIYYWNGSAWADTGLTAFSQENSNGRLYFTDGSVFTKGLDNYKVSYNYGYAVGSIPEDIKECCALIVGHKLKKFEMGLHRTNSRNVGEQSFVFSEKAIPDDAKAIINQYKRWKG